MSSRSYRDIVIAVGGYGAEPGGRGPSLWKDISEGVAFLS